MYKNIEIQQDYYYFRRKMTPRFIESMSNKLYPDEPINSRTDILSDLYISKSQDPYQQQINWYNSSKSREILDRTKRKKMARRRKARKFFNKLCCQKCVKNRQKNIREKWEKEYIQMQRDVDYQHIRQKRSIRNLDRRLADLKSNYRDNISNNSLIDADQDMLNGNHEAQLLLQEQQGQQVKNIFKNHTYDQGENRH